jgi:hypothetical protein
MRIEQALAPDRGAPQAGAGNERVRVAEGVTDDMFFLAGPLAADAPELPVERVERFALRGELVLVPFDQFHGHFRVERLEVHGVRVAEGQV